MPRTALRGFSPAALRSVMARSDLGPGELADLIGCSRQTVSSWLRGKSVPTARNISRIADTLGIVPADLTPGTRGPTRVADLRNGAGLTQRDVAARVRIAHSSYGAFEAGGKRPSPAIFTAIAACLGVDEETLDAAWRASREARHQRLRSKLA